MEKIIKDFKIKKPRIHTKEQALCEEIWLFFNKRLKFSMIMNFIKTKGFQFCYEVWNEIKQSNPKNRESLFMYKIGQVKIRKQSTAPD